MKNFLLLILLFLSYHSPVCAHEGTGEKGHPAPTEVETIADAALGAYEEITRILKDGFQQIREGKKEITLTLNLDDNPKTKEKIVISPESFYQLGDLIKKQVDQSVNEIQKNVQP